MHPNVPKGFQPFPEDQGFTNHIGPLYFCVDDGVGVMGFVVRDIHMNPAGICHGGMMMTLMDMAVGMNVQLAAETEAFSPTIQMSYDFLQPAFENEWLVSEINFRHATRPPGLCLRLRRQFDRQPGFPEDRTQHAHISARYLSGR